ncbi:MAG: radical SAM protein [bacterium]|nr:radical SAM protein [bacterium]
MRVLLIKPISTQKWEDDCFYPEIGLGYLATTLKKHGHQVEILDCVREELDFPGFKNLIGKRGPDDFYGFKVYSMNTANVNRQIDLIRELYPRAVVAAGGPHPSGVGEKIFSHIPRADYAFQGEGEPGLPKLLSELQSQVTGRRSQDLTGNRLPATGDLSEIPGLIYRENGEVKANPPAFVEDLDSLGYPDWEALDVKNFHRKRRWVRLIGKDYFPILTSRGCPYACSYCAAFRITGRKVRRHSIEYVLGWIETLHRDYGIKYFSVSDDAFTQERDYVITLCREILARRLEIKWDCGSNAIRFDRIDPEMLHLMEQAGCFYVTVAIESGSERILKDMNRRSDLPAIRAGIELIKRESKMAIGAFFILGYPTETREDIMRTIRLARSLPIDAPQFFLFTPHPGTPVLEKMVADRKINLENWDLYNYFRPSIPLADVSLTGLKLYQAYAYLSFFLRPRLIGQIVIRYIRDRSDFSNLTRFLSRIIKG